MDQERQRSEVATWRLVAAVAKATPVERVVEMHAGGGQYDTVQLHASTGSLIDCNRPGRVHVHQVPLGAGSRGRDLLGQLDHGLREPDALAWLLGGPELAAGPSAPVMISSLEVMAKTLATGVGRLDGRTWEWRNGRLDASDAVETRHELFAAIPATRSACTPAADDLLGIPAYRFWFLLADGAPVLAIEPSAGQMFVGDTTFQIDDADEGPWREAVLGPDGDHAADTAHLTPTQRAELMRATFKPTAVHLAGRVVGHSLEELTSGFSARAVWYHQQRERLIATVGPHEHVDVMDDVLAYALAWQGDADLILIVPEGHLGLTMERLAWVDTPVRVFTYWFDLEPRPVVVPSRAEVLAAAAKRPLRATSAHALTGERSAWVADLMQSANEHWALVAAHRKSYRSWHCLGRQVLKIQRKGSGLQITAGVDYGSPSAGEEPAEVVHLDDDLDPVTRARLELRLAKAIHARFAGEDTGHVEHRMQAALAATGMSNLGFVHVAREYPAWRGDGRPGYIDFLAIDRRNSLHVVETKVGTADVKGVLQTLDYATWVAANAAAIRQERGWPEPKAAGTENVVLDFVLAPKGTSNAIGPYFAGQLEALAGSLQWRVAIVEDPLAYVPVLEPPLWRSTPQPGKRVSEPVQTPRWVGAATSVLGLLT